MRTVGRRRSERGRSERGSITVEFVLILPLLLLLMAGVVGGARVWWARSTVTQLAGSAARQASITRTEGEARVKAIDLVKSDAAASGLRCVGGPPGVQLDTAGFSLPVGSPAVITAVVTCEVSLSDVLLPGFPGSLTVAATATSTLDRYRGRS